jgi:TolB protein
LTGDENVADVSPVWSPDGQWIAFSRKSPAAATTAQIWVMRRDGSQARVLTNDADFYSSAPAWSPDGHHLVFQRFSLQGVNAQPGIWLIDMETGSLRELATPGNRPTWLP